MVVVQEEVTGCGIASVANIVGLPYATVKDQANSMGIYAKDEVLYSDTVYVRRLLRHFGYVPSADEVPFEQWKDLPDLALLSINYYLENDKLFWHWVVFTRASGVPVVFDSSPDRTDNVRTDFDAMNPKWYIEVSKVS